MVAERTGYPADMLNLDMELDTDLGIDSIKKVEILSTVRERVGDVPGDLAAFATLRTLREIAEQYAQPGPAAGEAPAGRALADPAGPAARARRAGCRAGDAPGGPRGARTGQRAGHARADGRTAGRDR